MTTISATICKNEKMPKTRLVRLGDHVTRIGSGVTPRGGQSSYVESGVPLIRSMNVHLNRFEPRGLAYVTAEQDHAMEVSRVNVGDVLLNITGASIGRVCVVPPFMVPANVNQHVAVIRSDGSWIPEFLSFYFSTPSFQRQILADQAGATRQALTKSQIEDFEVPLPPLDEQRRIAEYLIAAMEAVDRARRAAQERCAASEALAAAYLADVFAGPESMTWPTQPLGTVCRIDAPIVDPKLPRFRDLPHVNGENIERGTGKLFKTKSAAEDGMTSGKYLFDAGVVLYSKLRPYLRKVVVADFPGVCSADMYPLVFDRDRVDLEFAKFCLLSQDFTEYAVEASARARMPKLNREQLLAFGFPLPLLADQRRIASGLTEAMQAVDRARQVAQEQLTLIDSLPAAYLRQAFEGLN